MPNITKLLPQGIKLAPGTLVKMIHSDAKNNTKKCKIYEIVPVCEDGISVKSSLPPEQLEGLVRTSWKVCIPGSDGKKIQYCDQVRTEDVKAGKSIRLCKKPAAPKTKQSKWTYARVYHFSIHDRTPHKKSTLISKLKNLDNSKLTNTTNTAQCLEVFLKSELQYIPYWYSDTGRPCPSDFPALLNFITPPQEEEASTSAAASSNSILERTATETPTTND